MLRDFSASFEFTANRSSGPGGQNVNKVNSKVELRFNILNSGLLTEDEQALLYSNIPSKITADGWIIITSQTERSQLLNKEKCIEKFYRLIESALRPRIKRKPTRISAAARARRRKEKIKNSEIKNSRKKSIVE